MPDFINISDDYGESQIVDLAFYKRANPDGIFVEEKDGIYEFEIKAWVQKLIDCNGFSIEDIDIYSDFHGALYQVAELTTPSSLYNVEFVRNGTSEIIDSLRNVSFQTIMDYINDVKTKGYRFYALENLAEFAETMRTGGISTTTVGLLEIGTTIVRVWLERVI